MAQRQNSYAREAQRNLRDGCKAAEQARQEQRDAMLTDRSTGKLVAEAKMRNMAERFDALQVGDTLADFGMGHMTVAKKNAKSVVTDGGNRWTRQELTGVK